MTNLDLSNLYFSDIIKMFESQNIIDQAVPLIVMIIVLIFQTLNVFEKGEQFIYKLESKSKSKVQAPNP